MKISIGMDIQPGAWGGGNQFGKALAHYLMQKGHEVLYDLNAKDIDIILLAEPDRKLKISAYDHGDILRYLLLVNRRALVVHRVNNTSEARNDLEKQFNQYRILANRVADHTVFVSQWVLDRYRDSGYQATTQSIIFNGADHHFWQPVKPKAPLKGPLKIVTHHWSNHPNKGIDIYQQLDALLATSPWCEQFEFTYIGRLPDGVRLFNSHHIPPKSGQELLLELCNHDIYLTAARFEAGANHPLEGALCGLPLLYLNSGSMAEYCAGFGLEYTTETLAQTLKQMGDEYDQWAIRIKDFPYTAQRMCQSYLELFEKLLNSRELLCSSRYYWRSPLWFVRTLFNRDRRR